MIMQQDVYYGRLKLEGEDHKLTVSDAFNYAASLVRFKRFEEARSLMRKWMPVSQRVLGANHDFTLRMRALYAQALYLDASATLDDLREAVTTLEETERTARRVFGAANPLAKGIERSLRDAQAVLRAREAPGS